LRVRAPNPIVVNVSTHGKSGSPGTIHDMTGGTEKSPEKNDEAKDKDKDAA
jgi:hypothetical protein